MSSFSACKPNHIDCCVHSWGDFFSSPAPSEEIRTVRHLQLTYLTDFHYTSSHSHWQSCLCWYHTFLIQRPPEHWWMHFRIKMSEHCTINHNNSNDFNVAWMQTKPSLLLNVQTDEGVEKNKSNWSYFENQSVWAVACKGGVCFLSKHQWCHFVQSCCTIQVKSYVWMGENNPVLYCEILLVNILIHTKWKQRQKIASVCIEEKPK